MAKKKKVPKNARWVAPRRTTRLLRASKVIRHVRRTHPLRNLRVPSALELARALDAEGLLR